MIAQSFTSWEADQRPVYYFYCYNSSDYYWRNPDPEPSARELRARWWKHINAFLERLEPVFAFLPTLIRKVQLQRIHHERQYPRVIKYRNNRMP